jgi:exodeoxyribonuclease V alpha subunit
MSADIRPLPNASEHSLLETGRSLGLLSPLDVQFSVRLAGLYGEESVAVRWALAIASRQEAAGHVCADLHRLASVGLVADTGDSGAPYSALAASDSVENWIQAIRNSALVEVVSSPSNQASDSRPLVLDDRGRLYLRRAYESQRTLASLLAARARNDDFPIDWTRVEAGFERFGVQSMAGDDAPERALRMALARPLSIITGGPGTGKTTIVARLIALLLEQAIATDAPVPRVRLLAPTGKAAAAMSSAFARERASLDVPSAVRDEMVMTAETIHRALYAQTRRDAFGRPQAFQLKEDVVVVDEASMVDLDMMTRLFSASEKVGRIVLLGDPDQLASVDSGAVLAELCAGQSSSGSDGASGNSNGTGLDASIVTLRTSYRFSAAGGVGRLADAIRRGDADEVIAILDDPNVPEVERCEVDSIEAVRTRLIEASRDMHRAIQDADAPDQKLDRMGDYRVLCAHRRGPLGVESLSAVLDETAAAERHTTARSGWWRGRMLLVTHNAPDQDLWNGDVGLIEDSTSGLRALFPDRQGGVRALSAARMPMHESAIAMSVHKSQGSEFDVVDLVLGDRASRLMTRELLYTGVTRARGRLRIHASESVVRDAVVTRVSRDSALAQLLWAD